MPQTDRKTRIYADHNASSPLRPEAREAMLKALELPTNPSSIHAEGRRARAMVETARRQVATLVDADPEAVVFTSGATEAIAMALQMRENGPFRPLMTEHAAVLAAHSFSDEEVLPIPVDPSGLPLWTPQAVETGLLAVQMANSETGVIAPRPPRTGGFLFRDAVQAAGKISFTLESTGADLICISSHKLGGPQGAAALIARTPEHLPKALIRGGGQEKGRRGGTENVAAIAGFGAASAAARADLLGFERRTTHLRDALEFGLASFAQAGGFELSVHGAGAPRLPNTSCFSVTGLDAATALMAADLAGISISSGAACSSGKVGKSHVLAAMGVADRAAKGALRVSFGWNSAEDDAARLLEFFSSELPRLLG
ncbi:MAG: aminotransferase class V-fold PLP-dependent enzyme [Pseudomonadota bacterium]